MYEILLKLRIPGELHSVRARERCIEALVEALARIDLEWMREHPGQVPALYGSGVRYRDHVARFDEWADLLVARARGWAKCEAAAAWRLAELWAAGVPARAMVRYQGGRATFHALVAVPGGESEDPSRALGMRI